ncbi:6602_t:CDS:2 [Ambispora gerdemannii]|uniref:6602_t:CDS:1 n=1 Tax=Ambispora gerdemannii TaxID=144530 RepID=A0A9N9BLT4_9GLOM|nr:6602_t:CDS:2 [Ambispora gerdemannii]
MSYYWDSSKSNKNINEDFEMPSWQNFFLPSQEVTSSNDNRNEDTSEMSRDNSSLPSPQVTPQRYPDMFFVRNRNASKADQRKSRQSFPIRGKSSERKSRQSSPVREKSNERKNKNFYAEKKLDRILNMAYANGEELFEVKWVGESETEWRTKQTLSKWPEILDKFLHVEQLKANNKNYHLQTDIPQWETTYKWEPFTHDPIDTPFQRVCLPLLKQRVEKNRRMLLSSRREYQNLHIQMYDALCLERIKTPKEQQEQEGRIESVEFVEDKAFWENLKMF